MAPAPARRPQEERMYKNFAAVVQGNRTVSPHPEILGRKPQPCDPDGILHNSRLAALGVLAAGVAHEINAPNGLVLLNLQAVSDLCLKMMEILDDRLGGEGDFLLGALPYSRVREELPRLFDDALGAAGRIRGIVEDLKDFARAGTRDPGEEVDVNAAAAAALRLCASLLRNSTDRFTAEYGEKLPKVRGHAQRIEQIVVNLVMNACQALPERSRGVHLRTRFDPRSGCVELVVGDEGAGIAPKDLPRITEPFFTTRREAGGSGLGLSVCANIVKEYGGTLRFASEPGKGTEVTVALPALPEEIP